MPAQATKRRRGANGNPVASDTDDDQRAAAGAKPSIRLTVKAPPSKLRQAVNSSEDLPPYPHTEDTPEPPVRNARATRNPRKVVDPDSDDDMDDAEGDEDEDGEGEDDDEDDEQDDDEDDEGEDDAEDDEDEEEEDDEDDDADEDTSMADVPHPPPPVIKTAGKAQAGGGKKAKIDITVTTPNEGTLKSVEAREEETEDLSDLGDDDEEEGEPDDEEDAEGDSDSDMEGSRDGTPDLNKLTRRQRAAYEESLQGGLMALSNEAQKKKQFTAEEHATRRAEMARRRKNLSEKRNEEEKMDTINKLLKKPAPKRRTRAEIIAAANAADAPTYEDDEETSNPIYVRWVNNRAGSSIGVPTPWLEGPVGQTLATGWTKPPPPAPAPLIEEVQ